MSPAKEKSSLKRARGSTGEDADLKKPRRSQRVASQSQQAEQTGPLPAQKKTPLKQSQLPSPITHEDSVATEAAKDDRIMTPPPRTKQAHKQQQETPESSPSIVPSNGALSPPSDTQAYSQFLYPPVGLSHEVQDEVKEGVWGYLIPLDHRGGDIMVLRRRTACPMPKSSIKTNSGRSKVQKMTYEKQEELYEQTKIDSAASSGYLIGRHPECDRVLDVPTVSNRHCLIFSEHKEGDTIAVLEDLSGNGTFVNDVIVGRNKRRVLEGGEEISILNEARFTFKYPRLRHVSGFSQQYTVQEQLGKGHFATVYLAVDKSTGMKFAVKKFDKRPGPGQKSMVEGLQQEIAVLMGVSHPNVLCLKDTYNETDGVYLILELAPEGELFNWIVMKSKLSEVETRKVFIQLFQGLKYLHDRNIVHRDIKPENILLVDRDLSVKLADFGLAKIIGEESFTTTLCGTPSYVAPEILEASNHRRYTRAVDIWSLGVVLYICLCGFPPFSDELYSPENPYTLSQQIKLGRFDYPCPYWDPVSDLALDLIDKMMTVDVEKRISIEGCLEHPWTTQRNIEPGDSTEGLAGAMGQLDFSRRKPQRERTMLSAINDIHVSREVDTQPNGPKVKVFAKNSTALPSKAIKVAKQGATPSKQKKGGAPTAAGATAAVDNPRIFMGTGDDGAEPLFSQDVSSRYPANDAQTVARGRG